MDAEADFIRQARIAAEAAFRTLHPAEPFDGGEAYVAAAELYRQAIHWGLAAHAKLAADSPIPSVGSLLETLPESTLRSWAGNDAKFETCVRHLRSGDYTVYATLGETEQRALCDCLNGFYQALLVPLVPRQKAAEWVTLKRNLRLLVIAALGLAIVVGAWQGFRRYRQSRDLALDATWSSSSVFNPALECRSPEQECKEGKDFFFCTKQENNPWFKLDLKKNRKFSSVELVNRQDCCRERANPLTVSVSSDGKTWEVVAERKTEFSTFTASFPEVSARYVKIEIPKTSSILHLTRVRVFP